MISIIVPVYNAASYIEETITMVKRQSYEDWELLLVNDCSQDDSLKVITKHLSAYPDERIRVIDKSVNEGAAKARNTGLDHAKGRYIAFLDADDLWYSDKLKKEMEFMEKRDVGFVFSGYDFGDEVGVPTGKVTHVPRTLTYKQALTRTVIFTSTVLFDTEKIDKSLMYMPNIASEDSATWWNILKSGVTAYGIDEPLVIYRRPPHSLSSNKKVAIERIWNLYRRVEGLSFIRSVFCLVLWAYQATMRRVVNVVVWRYLETFKRFITLELSVLGIILQTLLYAYCWFNDYYLILSANRISKDGFNLGVGLKLYYKGHLLILAIYFVLLLLVTRAGNGAKIGYQTPSTVIPSQIFAIVSVDVVTYFQLAMIRNWLIPVEPMVRLLFVQVFFAVVWAFFSDAVYRRGFPAKEILVVRSLKKQNAELIEEFNARQDRFRIVRTIDVSMDIEMLKRECLYWYGAVVLEELDKGIRDELMEFCYRHYVRVYYVPSLSDLMVYSSTKVDIFEIPVLELKEYSITWEKRIIKRFMDLVLSLFAMLFTGPVFLWKLWSLRKHIGKALLKETYAGMRNREITLYRWADRDAPTAITMFPSVFAGDLSIVGPKPIRKERNEELLAMNESYFHRLRVKPGVTGYAQIYGKHEQSDSNAYWENNMKLDQIYIQRYSIGMDIRILMKRLGI